MAEVIRQDVIEISFKSDLSVLNNINSSLDELKKTVTNGVNDGLDDMKNEADKAKKSVNNLGNEADGIKDIKSEADKAKEGIGDLGDSSKKSKTLLEKLKGVSFTKLTSGLKKVSSKLTTIAKKAGTTAYNALKKVASISFKTLTAGITAAATGIGAIVKSSVEEYADYEQQIGGVETLFGDSASTVEENANNAYKTAGLSANEYMETTTSFAASLLQGLDNDTEKAAEYADRAIVDMSDNANKMGTSMESIQNAYQGFAKQNYTMLDNLKLGYGGTKTEMERLIKDASKLTGIQKDLGVTVDADSTDFSNIVNAISVIQESLDISGTTAYEASTTISGSLSSLKAAWSNMLSALIKGGDSFDQCLDNLIESLKTFGKNLLPAIESSLGGISDMVDEFAPYLEEYLPQIVEDLLPPLITAATSLVAALIKSLPTIFSQLWAQLPDIVDTIVTAIVDAFGDKFPKLKQIGTELVNTVKNNLPTIKTIGGLIVGAIGVTAIVKKLKPLFTTLSKLKKSGSTKSGGIFSSITNIFESLAKAKTKNILKGMANLAIIIVGITAITAGLVYIAPKIAQLGDIKSFATLILLIAAVGVVGTALAKCTDLIKDVKPSTVVKGLADIAIIIGGLTALIVVIGAVTMLGFDLGQIAQIIVLIGLVGVVGTALVALTAAVGLLTVAAGELIISGLGTIVGVLAAMTAIIITFGELSKINGFNDFIKSGGDTLALLFEQIGKIVGSLIGGFGEGVTNSLEAIGNNLSNFATAIQPLFTALSGVDLSGAGDFFSGLGNFLIKVAGNSLLSKFTGNSSLADVGTQLSNFATSSTGFFSSYNKYIDFFTAVGDLPDEAFTRVSSMFKSLADIKKLPDDVTFLTDFLTNSKQFFTSYSLFVDFFSAIGELDEACFTKVSLMFKSLSSISDIPNSGGKWQELFGENDITTLGENLASFATSSSGFFTLVNGLNLTNLNGLWASLKQPSTITATSLTNVSSNIDKMADKTMELPQKFATAITSASSVFVNAIKAMWNSANSAALAGANKVVSTVNTTLNKIKSASSSTDKYASGTSYHKGGNAIVNDGRGAEIVQFPNGSTFLPQGKNVLIPNAPKGMKVLNAQDTAKALGRKTPTYHYASGIGSLKYSESKDYTRYSNSVSTNETNTYAPVFNLTISGSTDDKVLARKVKKWISESLDDTFENLGAI